MADSWVWTDSASNGPARVNVNPFTTPFRQADLDQSTFSMDFPTFDRGISTSSLPFVPGPAPLVAMESLDQSINLHSNSHHNDTSIPLDFSSIPAPFEPIRSISGASIPDFSAPLSSVPSGLPSSASFDISDHFLSSNAAPAPTQSNYSHPPPPVHFQSVMNSNELANNAMFAAANGFPGFQDNQESHRKRHRIEAEQKNQQAQSVPYRPNAEVKIVSSTTVSYGFPYDRPGDQKHHFTPEQYQHAINANLNGLSLQSVHSPNDSLPSAPPSLTVRVNSKQGSSHDDDSQSPEPTVDFSIMDGGKEMQKKIKHQQTDRQRRAKIKESMDALKVLVPLDPNQKPDQATIVAQTVNLVQDLKDEVAMLRAKIKSLELNNNTQSHSRNPFPHPSDLFNGSKFPFPPNVSQSQYTMPSPLHTMMASLNGAGVSLWRVALDGRIAEVNMVFEMITGFSSSEIVGKTPCAPPLSGSLSIMPQSFLRHFSSVSSLIAPNTPNSSIQSPPSPGSHSSTSSSSADDSHPSLPSHSPAPVPVVSGATIAHLPVIPQHELQPFFPFKPKTHPLPEPIDKPIQPQPHGSYLFNHLANLPANHVLKLLSRVATAYGDTLESIITLCLVRTPSGAPDYILCLSTPDCRRLVKAPSEYHHSVFEGTHGECLKMDVPV